MNRDKFFKIVLYLFLSAVTVVSFLDTTMVNTAFLYKLYTPVSFVLGLVIIVKVVFDVKEKWDGISSLILLLLTGFILIGNCYYEQSFVFEYLLLIVAARGMDYKKILKVYLAETLVLYAVTFLLVCSGTIVNNINYRDEAGKNAGMSFGFIYCTDFAAHVFYTLGILVFVRREKITVFENIAMYLAAFFVHFYSDANTSTICILLLAVFVTVRKLDKKGILSGDNKIIKKITESKWSRIIDYFMPFLAMLMIFLGIIFLANPESLDGLNNILSLRISTIAAAFKRFKVAFFGNEIFELGMGGRNGAVGLPDGYYFLDCSYASILFKKGLLPFVSILGMWVMISKNQRSSCNYRGVFVFMLIAVHSVMEHHLFEIAYNPFYLLAFSGLYSADNSYSDSEETINESEEDEGTVAPASYVKPISWIIIFALFVEIVCFNFESVVSRFDSVDNISDHVTGYYGVYNMSNTVFSYTENNIIFACSNFDRIPGSINVGIGMYELNNQEIQTDGSYTVNIYSSPDGTTENAVLVTSNTAYSGEKASSYFDSGLKEIPNTLFIEMIPSKKCLYYFSDFEFDGVKPIDINMLRFGGILLFLGIGYFFTKDMWFKEDLWLT